METTKIKIDGAEHEVHNYTDKPMPPLPDLDTDLWRERATTIADCEPDASYAYDLGGGLALYIDSCDGDITAAVEDQDMAGHILDWDHDCESAEWLAAWDLDGLSAVEIAGKDYQGACRVWREPNYYPGTCNAPTAGYARDNDYEIIEFATRAEAQAYVDEYYNAPSTYDGIRACNVLSHGQAGSDTLTIVKAD